MLSDGALAKVLARVPISIARKKTLGKLVKENGSGCVAKCSVKKKSRMKMIGARVRKGKIQKEKDTQCLVSKNSM